MRTRSSSPFLSPLLLALLFIFLHPGFYSGVFNHSENDGDVSEAVARRPGSLCPIFAFCDFYKGHNFATRDLSYSLKISPSYNPLSSSCNTASTARIAPPRSFPNGSFVIRVWRIFTASTSRLPSLQRYTREALNGNSEGYYAFPCSQTVNSAMGYGDGGKAWSIDPDDVKAFEIGNTGMCVGGAFFALDLGGGGGGGVPSWIVGDSFLALVLFFGFLCIQDA
ncbi:hypothetical protein D9758_010805 [Tetrapyrgos nigripes]|uniref:Uncharacterized protein n=1 Tax=Tetrapyrgos nigripes TaxID=182062 RepID=A0A8H5GI44_9AGAR|nr:hypothetical protein D9758_010805 [Tetrapyrgos nigripes]